MKILQKKAASTQARAQKRRRLPRRAARTSPPSNRWGRTNGRFVEEKFVVTTCRNGRITDRVMTAEQVQALDPTSVDFHWDTIFGTISIQPPHGKRITYFGKIPGLGGKVGERLLLLLIFNPRRLLGDREVRQAEGLEYLVGNALSARLSAIRRALGDSDEIKWFIVTQSNPFRVWWNSARGWRYIEVRARSTPKDPPKDDHPSATHVNPRRIGRPGAPARFDGQPSAAPYLNAPAAPNRAEILASSPIRHVPAQTARQT